jgi:phosphatidylglycerol:prolipoprotein diacylglycerol transferase
VLFYIALGVIAGGRLGYVLFYNPQHYVHNPLGVLAIWSGGMSFHGGLLGVIAAMWLYGRRSGRGFWPVADFIAPLVPVGLGAGRIGNFINHELWGRVTDVPWGMVFQGAEAGPAPRHPSQLYQAGLEGLVLFTALWMYSRRSRPAGRVSGLFLVLYGVFRFAIEFVREPDAHLGYLALGWVTMGQLLSLPMVLFGAWLLWRPRSTSAPA